MKKSLFMGLMAAMVFAGCSNEEIVEGPSLPIAEDGSAYLSVKISADRGTRGTDAGFEYGKAFEHAVTTADFYFYDADGVYVSKANVWNDGTENSENPNIEYYGENVIVLKGLTEKTFPKYLVTVLNQPENFQPGNNLTEMESKLTDVLNSTVNGTITNFVMTTTSYNHAAGNKAGAQPTYFTTEVTADKFQKDPTAVDDIDPVTIYVERLAAKVTVDTDDKSLVPVEGESNTYELKVSVAGGDNKEDDNDNIGAELIRVKFEGWGLNATAKESHVVKNINLEWSVDNFNGYSPKFAWNEEKNNFRSLWGKGTAYGKDLDANGTYGTLLNYNTWSDLKKVKFGSDAYCAENTNTADVMNSSINVAATSVVIAATILQKDGEGNWVSPDLIRYNGLLFKADAFKKYALNSLNTLGRLNYYRETEESTSEHKEYAQIDESYFELVNEEGNNGKVVLSLTKTAKDVDWRQKTPVAGKDSYDTKADIATLNLDAFTGNGFKGGKMYYNIPIEHLYDFVKDQTDYREGNYGVVRNHYYKLTVNSLEKLGTGVWDPDGGEVPIVPPPTDKDYYQVGVDINILSWRVVEQNVGL